MMIKFCLLVCVVTSLPVMGEAVRKLKREGSALNWGVVGASVLWCCITVCGALRLGGVLPPVDDRATAFHINEWMQGDSAPMVAVACAVGSVVANVLLWMLVHCINAKNKMWMMCISFFVFVLYLLAW